MRAITRVGVGITILTVLLSMRGVFAQTATMVTVRGFSFQPGEVMVAAGSAVQWTNRDSAPHQMASDDGTVTGPVMGDGDTFTFTFSTPGRVTYHCGIHPSMTGAVIVQ